VKGSSHPNAALMSMNLIQVHAGIRCCRHHIGFYRADSRSLLRSDWSLRVPGTIAPIANWISVLARAFKVAPITIFETAFLELNKN
jgi:hypothetical protein